MRMGSGGQGGQVTPGAMVQPPFAHPFFTGRHNMQPSIPNTHIGAPTSSAPPQNLGPHDHVPMSPPTPGPGAGNPAATGSSGANHVAPGSQGLMGLQSPPVGGGVDPAASRSRGIKSYHCRMCDQVSVLRTSSCTSTLSQVSLFPIFFSLNLQSTGTPQTILILRVLQYTVTGS